MADKKKVLIVDDEPQNLQVLMEILKKDYAVVAAKDGLKALEMAAKDPQPNIIFLDVMMPGIDGFEVLKRLKNDEKTSNIPVVFVSAEEDADNVSKAMQMKAVGYLIKPVDPEQVLNTVVSYSN